ncbi:hypothetical protein [Halomicrococcus gelatinilyticus]|uniref:hypothetical protein n=1 Tax=Halomicrococcus gelatinilyticus TaxID=1702103 RepID=UPI0038992F85
MDTLGREFERIREVVAEADVDGPLTAKEILTLLEECDEEFESAHEIATILGRQAEYGDVRVIRSSPYQYELGERA